MKYLEIVRIIQEWSNRNNLTKTQRSKLLEAYRRVCKFQNNKVDARLLTLDTISGVKSSKKFFKPSTKEVKNVTNWYDLTELGQTVVTDLMKDLPFTEKLNEEIFSGVYLSI